MSGTNFDDDEHPSWTAVILAVVIYIGIFFTGMIVISVLAVMFVLKLYEFMLQFL